MSVQILSDVTCCTRGRYRPGRVTGSDRSMAPAVSVRSCGSRCTARRKIVSTSCRTKAASRSILRLRVGHVGAAILPGVAGASRMRTPARNPRVGNDASPRAVGRKQRLHPRHKGPFGVRRPVRSIVGHAKTANVSTEACCKSRQLISL